MKRAWHLDELAQCWTLSPDELELLGNKTGLTRLRFAVLLKAFQFDGRFPDRRGDVGGRPLGSLKVASRGRLVIAGALRSFLGWIAPKWDFNSGLV